MEFVPYCKLARLGTEEVNGITDGLCWAFPKVDGTNSSVWMNDGAVQAGSRKRKLSEEKDNAGFYKYVMSNEKLKKFIEENPNHRVYGEFLVPHSLKTYRDNAWREFYIFDVTVRDEEGEEYFLPYEQYAPILEEYGLEYIPPMAKIKNPSEDALLRLMESNTYLIKDGMGLGEGIVIKNYGFHNKFGRQTWAKLVRGEFKEKHTKTMGCPEINNQLLTEERIVNDFCTESFVEKEYSKLVNEKEGWSSKYIGELLGRIYHELIQEEMWNIIKKYKNPKINFKVLNSLVVNKIKLVKKDVFR